MTNNSRVRFAPSPTGYLHIGGARTAIYNWIFAKATGGAFILRIEDTDEARSTSESVGGMLESLKWLGMNWDEGPDPQVFGASQGEFKPYFQMQRSDTYVEYAQKLLDSGNAYYCYCSQEELEEMRRTALLQKQPPKYDKRCRNLTREERQKKEREGRKPVVRFKMPEGGVTKFIDIVRGNLEFENKLLDDFILLKANSVPTYNFACTIDDYLMKITHVIRGDDHLSNTPRQICLYNALGWKPPSFAHLSMILGQDGCRLSKRHGATNVLEYKKNGYLPEALFNYLVLLGWSTQDSQQIFTKEELFEKFSLERCSKSPAVFDPQKLLWMNGEYVRKTPVDELIKKSTDFIKPFADENSIDLSDKEKYNNLRVAVGLEHEKIKLLTEIPKLIEFFYKEPQYDEKAVEKVTRNPDVFSCLTEISVEIDKLDNFTSANIEKLFREYASAKGIKTGAVFHPVRVAVSGRMEGPSLFEMLELLGKERVIKRIKGAVQKWMKKT
ncbi:MAG: glutamate--tRNA ligase [Elusimicrobiota bacterium]